MDARRIDSFGRGADRRGAAILLGSAVLHVAVLSLLGLDLASRDDVLSPSFDTPLSLDLEPWPDFARPGRMTTPMAHQALAPERQGSANGREATADARPDSVPQPVSQQPPVPDPNTAPRTAPASTEDAWRVRPGPPRPLTGQLPWGGDVCRNLSDFAAWQVANCRENGPQRRADAQGSPPAAEARIGQRRGDASERSRDAGFARQAAANDAWRAYTRGEGPYPGLRSLFTEH